MKNNLGFLIGMGTDCTRGFSRIDLVNTLSGILYYSKSGNSKFITEKLLNE